MKRHARMSFVRPGSLPGVGAAALAAAIVLVPALARAQDAPAATDSAAEARQQYQLGTQAFQQKRYSEAALHFEAAASSRTNAVALYTAALAWDLASRPERAADAYGRALDVGGLDAKQAALATDRITQLEKTLGTVAVTAAEGHRVQLDTFTEVATPARLHGAPGVHGLSIRAPGKPIEHRDVSLEAGKVVTLDLPQETKPEPAPAPFAAEEAAGPTPQAPTRDSFWSTRRVVGVGVAGVGVAALGSAIVLGLNASGAKTAYEAGPTRESFDHASSLETWTNVAVVSGALLAAGGAALILIPDKDEGGVKVAFAPGGAVMTGRF